MRRGGCAGMRKLNTVRGLPYRTAAVGGHLRCDSDGNQYGTFR